MAKDLESCPCVDSCKGSLKFYTWASGINKGMQPRLLHDINYMVLLVGAIYKCHSCNHIVYSTDPRILERIGMTCWPFFLLHRRGFTRAFIHYVIGLANEGLAITAIVRHIQSMQTEFIHNQIFQIIADYKYLQKDRNEDEMDKLVNSAFVTLVSKPFPSNDLIGRCIIIDFQQNEAAYTQHMINLPITNCIRKDHTFNVVSNIGYLRPDGKWITQYGSLFIALNKFGQIISWQLTNSTSLDEVEVLLAKLNERVVDRDITI